MLQNRAMNWFFSKRTRVYLVLVLTIVTLTVTAQMVVQYAIAQRKTDTHLINMAGRQRMLSQKLAKLAYQCQTGNCDFEELHNQNELWNRVHVGLQEGDEELGLPRLKDSELESLFQEINPVQRIMYLLVQGIQDNSTIEATMGGLAPAEKDFLKKMDNIVEKLEVSSDAKMGELMLLEISIAILSMLILLAEVLFIVRPTLKELESQNKRLKKIAWKQSHEVRKPVANILGLTNIINKDELSRENLQTFNYLQQSAEDLDKIIHEIVDETQKENRPENTD